MKIYKCTQGSIESTRKRIVTAANSIYIAFAILGSFITSISFNNHETIIDNIRILTENILHYNSWSIGYEESIDTVDTAFIKSLDEMMQAIHMLKRISQEYSKRGIAVKCHMVRSVDEEAKSKYSFNFPNAYFVESIGNTEMRCEINIIRNSFIRFAVYLAMFTAIGLLINSYFSIMTNSYITYSFNTVMRASKEMSKGILFIRLIPHKMRSINNDILMYINHCSNAMFIKCFEARLQLNAIAQSYFLPDNISRSQREIRSFNGKFGSNAVKEIRPRELHNDAYNAVMSSSLKLAAILNVLLVIKNVDMNTILISYSTITSLCVLLTILMPWAAKHVFNMVINTMGILLVNILLIVLIVLIITTDNIILITAYTITTSLLTIINIYRISSHIMESAESLIMPFLIKSVEALAFAYLIVTGCHIIGTHMIIFNIAAISILFSFSMYISFDHIAQMNAKKLDIEDDVNKFILLCDHSSVKTILIVTFTALLATINSVIYASFIGTSPSQMLSILLIYIGIVWTIVCTASVLWYIKQPQLRAISHIALGVFAVMLASEAIRIDIISLNMVLLLSVVKAGIALYAINYLKNRKDIIAVPYHYLYIIPTYCITCISTFVVGQIIPSGNIILFILLAFVISIIVSFVFILLIINRSKIILARRNKAASSTGL